MAGQAPDAGIELEVAEVKRKRAQSHKGAMMVPADAAAQDADVVVLPAAAAADVDAKPSPMAQLKPVYLALFVDTMGISITIPVLPYYALAFGASALELGLLMTAYSGAAVVGSLIMGVLSDRFGAL
jgi:hypothetical protein